MMKSLNLALGKDKKFDGPTRAFPVKLLRADHARLQRFAARQGRPMTDVVRELVLQELDRQSAE